MKASLVEEAYEIAKTYYQGLGYDTESAIAALSSPPRCPFTGFDGTGSLLTYVTSVRQQQRQDLMRSLGGDGTCLDAVYDEHCLRCEVPVADEYIADVERYINSLNDK